MLRCNNIIIWILLFIDVAANTTRQVTSSPGVSPPITCQVRGDNSSHPSRQVTSPPGASPPITCQSLVCAEGTVCRQAVVTCIVGQTCPQPPAECQKVVTSLSQQAKRCPPGLRPDVRWGRTIPCTRKSDCAPRSRCLSANPTSKFICCSSNTPPQPVYHQQLQHQTPVHYHSPTQHQSQSHHQRPIHHVVPYHGRTRVQQPHNLGSQYPQPQHQYPKHLHAQPAHNARTHQGHRIQAIRHQQAPVHTGNHQPVLQTYIEPWNQPQRETEYATVIRHQEVEYSNPRTREPEFNQLCPKGFATDIIRGRPIQCVQDRQCASGSFCLKDSNNRLYCCSRDSRSVAAEQSPAFQDNRQKVVSYGSARHRAVNNVPTRLSYPISPFPDPPPMSFNTGRNTPRVNTESNYDKLMSSINQVPPTAIRKRVRVTRPKPRVALPMKRQGNCPDGYTSDIVGGHEVMCVSDRQCTGSSTCQSKGLFQGSICCSKRTGTPIVRPAG